MTASQASSSLPDQHAGATAWHAAYASPTHPLLPGSHLSGRELAACACTCKHLRDHLAEDDSPWRALCQRELGLAAPLSPATRQPLLHFRQAYAEFQAAYGRYGDVARRAW